MSNEPAFPLCVPHVPGVQEGGYEAGMTLRDYFAAKAMAALIGHLDNNGDVDTQTARLAEAAYGIADLMLQERQK